MPNSQSNKATTASTTASNNAAGYGATAAGINSNITPELEKEANGQGTGYAPTDLNAMKVGAAEAVNSGTGSANEKAILRGERTGDNSAVSGAEDENARSRARALGDVNLKINTANAGVKQDQQQNALRTLSSLYGTNVGAQTGNENTSVAADKLIQTQPGWVTGLQDLQQAGAQATKSYAEVASA